MLAIFSIAQVLIKIEVRITVPSPANRFTNAYVGNIMLECTLCLRNLQQCLCCVLEKVLNEIRKYHDYLHVPLSASRNSLRAVKCLRCLRKVLRNDYDI